MATNQQLVVTISNISYRHLLLSPKDFVALTDILSRSVVVDDVYIKQGDGYQTYYVQHDNALIKAETISAPVITREQHEAIKAAEAALAEEIKEAA